MDPNMDGNHDINNIGKGNGYCKGEGSVMNNGFGFMKESGSCILYLFQGAVVNTAGKYAAAIIGTFFLAFAVEGLRHFRFWMRTRRATQTAAAAAGGGGGREGGVREQMLPILVEAFLFGLHMLMAYLVMLLVMLYEWAIFISLLLGLTAGYFTMEMWEVYRVAQGKQQASALGAVGGGCGCVDEVIQVAAAVGKKGGGKGGEEDSRNPNSRV